jgi:TonB family protein
MGMAVGLGPVVHAAEKAPAVAPAPSVPTKVLLVDGPAVVKDWVSAAYPADALKEKIAGRVVTRVIVDESGNVTAARVLTGVDPRLDAAALAAVKSWKFLPAVEAEKHVPTCMDVPFEFDPASAAKKLKPSLLLPQSLTPRPAPRKEARPTNSPPGGYPEVLTERRLSGEVLFVCVVQPDGSATNVRIARTTHPDFVLPALAALARWEFAPAEQGDLKLVSELRGSLSFDSLGSGRAETLAAHGITTASDAPVSRPPLIVRAADPVWPHAHLLKGEGGAATIEFTVQPRGRVSDVKVLAATHPDFGRALAASMGHWLFNAGNTEGRTEPVKFTRRLEFTPPTPEGDDKTATIDPLARLVRLERGGEIKSGGDLDEKVTPIYRVAPVYPAALYYGDRPSGEAMIEFVIDVDGRSRLTRIVSATHEEFGWAAATAIGQWIFTVPHRGGKPTEVRVQIPVNFSPPPPEA